MDCWSFLGRPTKYRLLWLYYCVPQGADQELFKSKSTSFFCFIPQFKFNRLVWKWVQILSICICGRETKIPKKWDKVSGSPRWAGEVPQIFSVIWRVHWEWQRPWDGGGLKTMLKICSLCIHHGNHLHSPHKIVALPLSIGPLFLSETYPLLAY